ncbi:MAG: glycosyltransferase family 2 protein [Mycoplasma sp.]
MEYTMKLTLIITSYNGMPFIEDHLKTYKPKNRGFKIIFVDDCGTDKSVDRVKKITKDWDDFKVIKWTKNKGIAGTRKAILDHVDTEYVLMVDVDDFVNTDVIPLYEKYMDGETIVLPWRVIIRKNGDIDNLSFKTKNKVNYILGNLWCYAGTFVPLKIAKEVKWMGGKNIGEDKNSLATISKHKIKSVICGDLPFYYYLARAGSLSRVVYSDAQWTECFSNMTNTLDAIDSKKFREVVLARFIIVYKIDDEWGYAGDRMDFIIKKYDEKYKHVQYIEKNIAYLNMSETEKKKFKRKNILNFRFWHFNRIAFINNKVHKYIDKKGRRQNIVNLVKKVYPNFID